MQARKLIYGHTDFAGPEQVVADPQFTQPDAVSVTPIVLRRADPICMPREAVENQPGINDICKPTPRPQSSLGADIASLERMVADLTALRDKITVKIADIGRQLAALEI